MRYILPVSIIALLLLAFTFRQKRQYDVIIRNGLIYDGSGSPSYKADLAIQGDSIAAIGDLHDDIGKKEIDAKGMVVTPGFINMLSWADKDLLRDGRSMSDIKQGVTLEVFGEGWSPAPIKRKRANVDSLWTSLDGYFKWITKKGVTPNVASFVGGSSVRFYVLDNQNKKPTAAELAAMKNLVKQAMEDGAMGLGTSLIYVPALYASTDELIELSKVASSYGGMYITHVRSESDFIFQAMNETFRISREANIP
ncbi:MAG TPA: D-aminoacylase, partial [Cyclobacteriaceae bacterium]